MSKVDAPTYLNDITGEIKRWDERDIVFARKDLLRYFGADSTEYRAYYEIHP
jgi:2-hydroxy-3-keto-5-methylthiopentenyl-1-phosphate phosphatase